MTIWPNFSTHNPHLFRSVLVLTISYFVSFFVWETIVFNHQTLLEDFFCLLCLLVIVARIITVSIWTPVLIYQFPFFFLGKCLGAFRVGVFNFEFRMHFLQALTDRKRKSCVHRLVPIHHFRVLRFKWSTKSSRDKLWCLRPNVNGLWKLVWVTHLLKLLRLIEIHYLRLTKFMVWFDICLFDGVISVILQFIFGLGKIGRGIKTALKIIIFCCTILKILTLLYVALFLITSTSSTTVPMMSTLKSSNS